MIHLDTSFLIHALAAGSEADRALRTWLQQGEPIAVSCVGWAELLCGPLGDRHRALAVRLVPERVPFDEQDAAMAAELFNLGGRRRGSLADCMIAGTAIRRGARLATANPRDFVRFAGAGLVLASW